MKDRRETWGQALSVNFKTIPFYNSSHLANAIANKYFEIFN
jgi:hypothetical protein